MTDPQAPRSEDPEVPPWAISAGRLLGLSPVQTRWRLAAVARRWRAFRRELEPTSRSFAHQLCAGCGAVQPHDATTCSSCGARLSSRAARAMRALGWTLPRSLTGSALLGLATIVVYFRMLTAWPGQGLARWDLEALVAHGALWPPAVGDGQWWRLGTMAFVHIGVLHVVFNCAALSQAGPLTEEIYGRGRMVFAFMFTAVVAAAASAWVQPLTPTAGASGGLMGLVGLLAGWGHRSGTTIGRGVRDQMLKWGAYTMLFGVVIGANHVAHAAGFVAGAVLGAAVDTRWVERTRASVASGVLGAVGGLSALACALLALAPPAAARELGASLGRERSEISLAETDRAYVAEVERGCAELAAGRGDRALAILDAASGTASELRDVVATCRFVELVRARCDAYRRGGLEEALGDRMPRDRTAEATSADYFRAWCGPPTR